jgi:hypothetical protein
MFDVEIPDAGACALVPFDACAVGVWDIAASARRVVAACARARSAGDGCATARRVASA